MRRGRQRLRTAFAAAWLSAALPAGAASFEIRSGDDPGQGIEDPTPREPMGGNPGETLGEQRRIALAYAMSIWAEHLGSAVPIVIEASFADLPCSRTNATLGLAGPASAFTDFDGAPYAATLYPSALADSLAGVDLDPGERDIVAIFNGDLDRGCFSRVAIDGWYYGLDGLVPPTQVPLVTVALHELAHGLGFGTSVDIESGARCCSLDDAEKIYDDPFMRQLEDHDSRKLWPEMSDNERRESATDAGDLHWVGAAVRAAATMLQRGRTGDHVHMYAPRPVLSGSSVAHFSDTLSPDELLEPFYIDDPRREISVALLSDLGWRSPTQIEPTPTATATMTAGPTLRPTPSSAPGDANCDRQLTAADITAAGRAAGGGPACDGADADGDGVVDDHDVARIIAMLFS